MVVVAVVAGFGACRGFRVREPLFLGRRLSSCLAAYSQGEFGGGGEFEIALRQAGTNALPCLFEMVAARDSHFKVIMNGMLSRQRVFRWRFRPAYHYHQGAECGFGILGPIARPAVPALLRLLDSKDQEILARAICCLGAMGPAARDAVPVLLRHITDPDLGVRASSKGALGKIHAEPALVVPALIVDLKLHPQDLSAAHAIRSLGQFGSQARQAVPVIRPFLESGHSLARGWAAVALEHLDAHVDAVGTGAPASSAGAPAPLHASAAAIVTVGQGDLIPLGIAPVTPAFEEWAFNVMLSKAAGMWDKWQLGGGQPLTMTNLIFGLRPTIFGFDGYILTRDGRFQWIFRTNSMSAFYDEDFSRHLTAFLMREFSPGGATEGYDEEGAGFATIKSKITAKEATAIARDRFHQLGLTEAQLDLIEPPEVTQYDYTDRERRDHPLPLFKVGWKTKQSPGPGDIRLWFEISGITKQVVEYDIMAQNMPLTPTPTNYYEMLGVKPPKNWRQEMGLEPLERLATNSVPGVRDSNKW